MFRQDGELTSPEVVFGQCCIGDKAEVYDAELHAIQEGLLLVLSMNWPPTQIVVCADNQSALALFLQKSKKAPGVGCTAWASTRAGHAGRDPAVLVSVYGGRAHRIDPQSPLYLPSSCGGGRNAALLTYIVLHAIRLQTHP